jgi:hypothetical protein
VVLFFHGNAPDHRTLATHKKLAYLAVCFLDHTPYFPDLTPLDYHPQPGLKKSFECLPFLPDMEVIAAAESWLYR